MFAMKSIVFAFSENQKKKVFIKNSFLEFLFAILLKKWHHMWHKNNVLHMHQLNWWFEIDRNLRFWVIYFVDFQKHSLNLFFSHHQVEWCFVVNSIHIFVRIACSNVLLINLTPRTSFQLFPSARFLYFLKKLLFE